MSADRPISVDRIREIIRTAPDGDPNSWVVGHDVRTRDGREIQCVSVYLADPDTAVLVTNDGETRIAITEITNLITRLESPGPE
jgi:hypothetical protein